MWLRVIISLQNIRKVQLSQLPDSVDSLKAELKSKLEIQEDFFLQYEDPDFGNELCNLTDISELPAERAVLKIVWDQDSSVLEQSDTQSVSSLDTASVSTSSSQSSSAIVQSHMRSTLAWQSPFPIPTFSYDVELRLRKANEVYEQTNKALSVPREMKSHILEKIAEAVFALKAYPHTEEIETVASALVLKHPCLTEPGKGKGFDGWKMSIKFKLGNYRSKLRSAGCHEVNINRKRGGGDDKDKKIPLKKAKRGEVNYLPDHPGGQSDDTLEEERLVLVEELKKRTKDEILISQKMSLTFSLRRKEIVKVVPMVSEVLERWPALSLPNEVKAIVRKYLAVVVSTIEDIFLMFSCLLNNFIAETSFFSHQIGNEFKRITNVDLLDTFKSSLHQHAPQLLKLYRGRQGAFGKEMEDLLNKLDQQVTC